MSRDRRVKYILSWARTIRSRIYLLDDDDPGCEIDENTQTSQTDDAEDAEDTKAGKDVHAPYKLTSIINMQPLLCCRLTHQFMV